MMRGASVMEYVRRTARELDEWYKEWDSRLGNVFMAFKKESENLTSFRIARHSTPFCTRRLR
jgi:hypothetical protein